MYNAHLHTSLLYLCPNYNAYCSHQSFGSDLGYNLNNSLAALTSALVNGRGNGHSSAAESVAGSMGPTPETSPINGMNSVFMHDRSVLQMLSLLLDHDVQTDGLIFLHEVLW